MYDYWHGISINHRTVRSGTVAVAGAMFTGRTGVHHLRTRLSPVIATETILTHLLPTDSDMGCSCIHALSGRLSAPAAP